MFSQRNHDLAHSTFESVGLIRRPEIRLTGKELTTEKDAHQTIRLGFHHTKAFKFRARGQQHHRPANVSQMFSLSHSIPEGQWDLMGEPEASRSQPCQTAETARFAHTSISRCRLVSLDVIEIKDRETAKYMSLLSPLYSFLSNSARLVECDASLVGHGNSPKGRTVTFTPSPRNLSEAK